MEYNVTRPKLEYIWSNILVLGFCLLTNLQPKKANFDKQLGPVVSMNKVIQNLSSQGVSGVA